MLFVSRELSVRELNVDVSVRARTGLLLVSRTKLDDWWTERNGDDWGELNETGRRRLVSGGIDSTTENVGYMRFL